MKINPLSEIKSIVKIVKIFRKKSKLKTMILNVVISLKIEEACIKKYHLEIAYHKMKMITSKV